MRISSDAEVVHRWFERCHASGVALAAANDMGAQLTDAYTDAARRYHDLGHIRHVLDLATGLRLDEGDRETVDFALWFHDAVLDVTRSDNEARSAVLAQTWLTAQGLDCADRVGDLVAMTAGHRLVDPHDRPAAVVHDVDLAILGSIPEDYRRYVAAIRSEYSHLDDATFATGRRETLESLLAMTPLFVTPELGPVLESRARTNIEAELDRISSGSSRRSG